MPYPDQYSHDKAKRIPGSVLREMFDTPKKHDALAEEVAALLQEIVALREMLAPVPSLIATGRDVLEQFKQLKNENRRKA